MITSIRKRLWVVTVLMARFDRIYCYGHVLRRIRQPFQQPRYRRKSSRADFKLGWIQNTERVLYANSEVDYYGRKDYMWNQFIEKGYFR